MPRTKSNNRKMTRMVRTIFTLIINRVLYPIRMRPRFCQTVVLRAVIFLWLHGTQWIDLTFLCWPLRLWNELIGWMRARLSFNFNFKLVRCFWRIYSTGRSRPCLLFQLILRCWIRTGLMGTYFAYVLTLPTIMEVREVIKRFGSKAHVVPMHLGLFLFNSLCFVSILMNVIAFG